MSFLKTGFWWKSEHSTAAGSQRENESKAAAHFDLKVKRKILRHWRSCAARRETKKELNGCFSFLYYHINQKLINFLYHTDFCFCSLSFLFISISSGAMFPSSPTARNVLEKVDCRSASQTAGWKSFRVFDCTTQRHRWLPTPYPCKKKKHCFPANGSVWSSFARGFQNHQSC